MRTLMIGLVAMLVAVVCWSLGLAADEPTKKFGPEWTKDVGGKSYTRKQIVDVSRQTNIKHPYTSYTLPAESNTMYVQERDEKGDIEIGVVQGKDKSTYMSIEARMNDEGKARTFMVNFKRNLYFDLDGDGMIDAMVDNRDGKRIRMVLCEGQFVQIADSKDGFGGVPKGQITRAWGIGRKVLYQFEGSKWVAFPQ
jgi:hypothetical protein